MKATFCLIILLICLTIITQGQTNEADQFYEGYSVSAFERAKCDSLFRLIEERRKSFSQAYRTYGEKNGNHSKFTYNWEPEAEKIEKSLDHPLPRAVRHLTYYSYFDLAYGIFGYNLKREIVNRAIKDIPVNSVIWSLEPSLLMPIILAVGGEDTNRQFINDLYTGNNNNNLRKFIKGNLDSKRALKNGNTLPVLNFKYLADTSKHASTKQLQGRYVLLDIWATWCKPCIEEFPNLSALYQRRGPSLEFISISIDDGVSPVLSFISTHKELIWSMAIADRKEVLKALQVNGIPLTILIDPTGEILAYGNDLRNWRLERTLSNLKLLTDRK